MTSFFLPALLRSTTGKTAVFWVLSGLWGFITILPHALLTAQPTAVPVLPAPPPARGDARNPNPMPDTRVLAVVFLEWLQGPAQGRGAVRPVRYRGREAGRLSARGVPPRAERHGARAARSSGRAGTARRRSSLAASRGRRSRTRRSGPSNRLRTPTSHPTPARPSAPPRRRGPRARAR
jgi:hypothetical protein